MTVIALHIIDLLNAYAEQHEYTTIGVTPLRELILDIDYCALHTRRVHTLVIGGEYDVLLLGLVVA
jgi:hypothetical protein